MDKVAAGRRAAGLVRRRIYPKMIDPLWQELTRRVAQPSNSPGLHPRLI